MNYNQRSDDALKTELEYLREYAERDAHLHVIEQMFKALIPHE